MKNTQQITSINEWVAKGAAAPFVVLILFSVLSQDITAIVINTLFVAVLFAFQQRLLLQAKALVIRSQFSFFGKTFCVIYERSIPLTSITELTHSQRQHKNDLAITYKNGNGEIKLLSFSCLHQAQQTMELLSASGLKYSVHRPTQNTKGLQANDTKETVTDIFPLGALGKEIKPTHTIARFAMPLPQDKVLTPWVTAGIFALVTIGLTASSGNWVAACVFIALTYLSYWLARAYICNKHYFVAASPCSDIVVKEEHLFLPALLFTDRQARELHKGQVKRIVVKWNYYIVGKPDIENASLGQQNLKHAYVVDVTFYTDQGDTLALTGMSVNAQALLLALTHWHYPVSLERTNKLAMPIMVHVRIGAIIAVIGVILASLIKYF